MNSNGYDLLETAKGLIREYYEREFGEVIVSDFSNLRSVPLAYTTTEDEEHDIQVSADLLHYKIETFVDGELAQTEQYTNLEEMIEWSLSYMQFDNLVCLDEDIDEIIKRAAKRSCENNSFEGCDMEIDSP